MQSSPGFVGAASRSGAPAGSRDRPRRTPAARAPDLQGEFQGCAEEAGDAAATATLEVNRMDRQCHLVGLRPVEISSGDDGIAVLKYDWETGQLVPGME